MMAHDMYRHRRGSSRLHMVACGVSMVALIMVSQAAAQEDGALPSPAGDRAPTFQADAAGEIIVTARKREERLRDVPVAIAAVSGGELQRKNIVQLIDLSATVPTLQVSYATTQPFIYLRGFGSGSNSGFEQSVGKFVDNVYFGRDQDGRIPLFDLERLEVLKGPQIVAFGNSSTVGALNITTRKPGDRFQADGSIGYEFNRNELQAQGGVTVPFSPDASLRVAGLFQDLDRGQNINRLRNSREPTARVWAIRPTLRLQPASDLEITLRYEYDRVRRYGTPIQPIAQPLRPGALPFPEVDDRNEVSIDPGAAPISSRDTAGLNHWMAMGDVRYDVAGGTLISTTAYRKEKTLVQFASDGPNHVISYYQSGLQHYDQFSQELRFAGTYGSIDANFGGYFERNNLHINQLQYFFLGAFGTTGPAATPIGRVAYFDQRTKKYSAFMDLTYHFDEAFSLSAGLRYSRNEKRAGQSVFGMNIAPNLGFDTDRAYLDSYRSGAIDALLGPVLGTTPHVFPFGALRLNESFWQPQVIAQYKFDKNMAYAKYVKGDKAGGFDFLYSGATPAGASFRPEQAESIEAGLKGLIFDNRLDYSLTLFRTTFTALQQSVYRDVSFIVSNVGKARSQGVEAEFTYRPMPGLRMTFSGAYLDAKFISFPGAACSSSQNLVTPRNCTQDLSGAPQQFASKWTGSLAVDYESALGIGDYMLGGGASVFARTKYNADAYNDARMRQKGFAQLDAHLDLKPGSGNWTLSLFGRNLTDVQYLEYGILPPGQGTAALGTYSRGRQLGLRFSFNYR